MAEFSKPIADAIEAYLKSRDWSFKPADENGAIITGVQLRNKLKSVRILFRAHRDSFTVRILIPIGSGTEPQDLANAAEFITRANYGMRRGCFEMDFDDGEIGFRAGQFCENGDAPTHGTVEDLMFVSVAMVERYGDALLKVIHGFSTPQEAIREVER